MYRLVRRAAAAARQAGFLPPPSSHLACSPFGVGNNRVVGAFLPLPVVGALPVGATGLHVSIAVPIWSVSGLQFPTKEGADSSQPPAIGQSEESKEVQRPEDKHGAIGSASVSDDDDDDGLLFKGGRFYGGCPFDVQDGDLVEEEEVDPYYSDESDTLNLLSRGKDKEPLPLYKAREMVDYHLSKKERLNSLEIITDPKLEENLKEMIVHDVDEFVEKVQYLLDELHKEQEEEKTKKAKRDEVRRARRAKEKEERSRKSQENTEVSAKDDNGAGSDADAICKPKEKLKDDSEEFHIGGEGAVKGEDIVGKLPATSNLKEDFHMGNGDSAPSSPGKDGSSAVGETIIMSEAISGNATTASPNTLEGERDSTLTNEDIEESKVGDTSNEYVGVIEFGRKLKAIQEEEARKAKEAEGENKKPTLTWQTQLVLGPGGAWHPANRKVKVSVYVRELGLSKYAKLRLLALVGKRYNLKKDELTIVSERYQHRYENQKDVLRILVDLVEEAKKADDLVTDAKTKFLEGNQVDIEGHLQVTVKESGSQGQPQSTITS
eukprot:c26382_g1_i1 orf=160-1806(+)